MAVDEVVEQVINAVKSAGLIQLEVSARHVHLDRAAIDALFGEGHELTPKRELSQPGQYLEEERVDVIGPAGAFRNVAVLGPARKSVQVEVSFSDAFILGVTPPIRQSGDTKGSASITLKGPKGEIQLDEGVIVALRHIHITPEDAELMGLTDGQIVAVEAMTDRSVIFDDTVVRVSPKFRTRMHVDVDEGCAAHVAGFTLGRIIK